MRSLFLMLLLLMPLNSLALDGEFTTQGGFYAISDAFEKIALIFSNDQYLSLFYISAVMALFFGLMQIIPAIIKGQEVNLVSVFAPFVLGVAIFFGMIDSKGTIHLYDTSLNRTAVIGDIPDGVVFVASSLNMIRQGLIDIIDASSTSLSFDQDAGGISFNTILEATQRGVDAQDAYFQMSVRQYIDDCVIFEMQQPQNRINLENILHDSLESEGTGLWQLLSGASNPAVLTTIYLNDAVGITTECSTAYNTLNNQMLALRAQDTLSGACGKSGYDVVDFNSCQQRLEATLNYLLAEDPDAGLISANSFARQIFTAKQIQRVMLEGESDEQVRIYSNNDMLTNFISMGVVTNEWIPILQHVLTAITFALTPFLALLIPTGMLATSLSIFLGLFIHLLLWGIIDAMIHSMAVDYAFRAFEHIRDQGLSYQSVMMMPDSAIKALGIFGFSRTIGFSLAATITPMLTRYSAGHAMAMLTSNIGGEIRSAAHSASDATQTFSGYNKTLSETVMPDASMMGTLGPQPVRDSRLAAAGFEVGQGSALGSMSDGFGAGMTAGSQRVGSLDGVSQLASDRHMSISELAQTQSHLGGHQSLSSAKSFGEAAAHFGGGAGAMDALSLSSRAGSIAQLKAHGGVNSMIQTQTQQASASLGSFSGHLAALETLGVNTQDMNHIRAAQSSRAYSENLYAHGKSQSLEKAARGYQNHMDDQGVSIAYDDAMRHLAAASVVGDQAKVSAFGGIEPLHQQMLAHEQLSAGEWAAAQQIAKNTGISFEQRGEGRSKMQLLKETGALNAYERGDVSDHDLKQMERFHLLNDQTRAAAAPNIARILGFANDNDDGVHGMLSQLKTTEGMQAVARSLQTNAFADHLRQQGNLEESEALRRVILGEAGQTTMTLSDEDAKSFGFEEGGRFAFSTNSDGFIEHVAVDRGKEEYTKDIQSFDSSTKVSTGNQYQGLTGAILAGNTDVLDSLYSAKNQEEAIHNFASQLAQEIQVVRSQDSIQQESTSKEGSVSTSLGGSSKQVPLIGEYLPNIGARAEFEGGYQSTSSSTTQYNELYNEIRSYMDESRDLPRQEVVDGLNEKVSQYLNKN